MSEYLDAFLQSCKTAQYNRNDLILEQQSPCDHLYYLISGTLKVVQRDIEELSNYMTIGYIEPGEFFGEMAFFNLEHQRSAEVIAKTDVVVAMSSYENFIEHAQASAEIWQLLLTQVVQRLKTSNQKLLDLAYIDTAGRLARTLLELIRLPDTEPHPDGKLLHVSRAELASTIGCSREMVSRVLSELADKGLIHLSGRSIIVHT